MLDIMNLKASQQTHRTLYINYQIYALIIIYS